MTVLAEANAPMATQMRWNWRLVLACFLAASASLPIAMMSIGKLLLFLAALGWLGASLARGPADYALAALRSARVVLLTLLVFAASLLWTDADIATASMALVKHGKLLVIVLMVCLIRTRAEGQIALMAFAVGQFSLLALSWLVAAGIELPFLPPNLGRGVVFSSYLDQGVIVATSAAIFWHLQPLCKTKPLWPRWLAAVFVFAALASVLLVLIGRTAYVIVLALFGLAAVWALPARLRLAAMLGVPLLAAAVLFLASSHLPSRVTMLITESKDFSEKADVSTSAGWRLNAWQRSAEAIAESPFVGHGVGAWTTTVKRLQGENGIEVFGSGSLSNPHQEYLLWGVELGVGGTLLLVLLLLVLARDFADFEAPVKRAGISVVMAMAIACLFNSSIYDGLIGDYFCIVLGLLLALGLRTQDSLSATRPLIAPHG